MAQEAARKGVGLKALFLRDTFRNLTDTTQKTLEEWLGPLGTFVRNQSVTDFVMELGGQKHIILLRHGQTAQDASSFLSSDYGLIFLEEAAPAFTPTGLISPGIAEEVFDLAFTRLIQKGIDHPELVITCNPPTPQHWVNRRILVLPPDELTERGWAHFFFPREENEKNLRAGYYDELRKSLKGKDHILRRFVEGEVVSIYPGLPVFARDFRQSIHVVDDLRPVEGRPIIFGFDAGLTPACVWLQIDAFGRLLVLYELQGGYVDDRLSEQIGAEAFSDLIKSETAARFPGFKAGIMYADPAVKQKQQTDEKTVKQILEGKGFVVEPGEVDIASGIEAIRNRMTTLIDGGPAMLVSRHGAPIIIEAASGGYRYGASRDGTKVMGAEPIKDHYSHLIDALRYPCSKLFPIDSFFYDDAPPTKVNREWNVFDTRY